METEIKERGILFNGEMVKAILSGQKTQTRRVIKALPDMHIESFTLNPPTIWTAGNYLSNKDCCIHSPFGKPGDQLWVRETHSIHHTHGQHRDDGLRWGPWGDLPTKISPDGKQIAYFREGFDRCDPGRWKPSIHMPRWASRINLEITGVRVERVQQITIEDCKSEGCPGGHDSITGYPFSATPIEHYAKLWDSTTKPGFQWDDNPFVWCIEFKRVGELLNETF